MVDLSMLVKLYQFNAELIEKHTAGVSHSDSLKPLATDGNSVNWLLGHIISARTSIFEYVSGGAVWSEDQRVRYRHGSTNVTQNGPGVMRLETLITDFNESQRRLEAGLVELPVDRLGQATGYGEWTLGGRLVYLQFHETHHVGQLMSAAQALGCNGDWLQDPTL